MKSFIPKTLKKSAHRTFWTFCSNCMLILFSCCAVNTSAFAQASNCTLCDVRDAVNNNGYTLKMLRGTITDYSIIGPKSSGQEDNPLQLDLFENKHYDTLNNIDIIAKDQRLTADMNTISSNLVSYYLAGVDTKENEKQKLALIAAEDTSKTKTTMPEYEKALNSLTSTSSSASTGMNSVMNTDTLLGLRQYNETQKVQAQQLLRYLENLSPPPDVIRISDSFEIPYPDKSTTKIDLTKNSKVQPKTPLHQHLSNLPEYAQYVATYRSAIAARTMFINNLLRSYQERVVPDNSKDGISAAEADYKSATWRLEKSYRDEIKNASPVTISREVLFALADLNYNLYKLRQQNEQLIALQSLSNLQVNQFSSMMNSATTKEIARSIYCWYNDYKDQECKKNSGAANTTSGIPSELSTLLPQ